jgi:hypothetical protein
MSVRRWEWFAGHTSRWSAGLHTQASEHRDRNSAPRSPGASRDGPNLNPAKPRTRGAIPCSLPGRKRGRSTVNPRSGAWVDAMKPVGERPGLSGGEASRCHVPRLGSLDFLPPSPECRGGRGNHSGTTVRYRWTGGPIGKGRASVGDPARSAASSGSRPAVPFPGRGPPGSRRDNTATARSSRTSTDCGPRPIDHLPVVSEEIATGHVATGPVPDVV